MMQTIKEYFEEFVLLPSAVKSFIFLSAFILIGFSVFFGLRSFVSNRQIEKLSRHNFELNRQIEELRQKANKFEIKAGLEKEKAESFECLESGRSRHRHRFDFEIISHKPLTKKMAKEFSDAPEVRQIAEKLIEIFKPELEGFEIRYVMSSENPKKDGRECIGLARKVSGFYAYLAGSDEDFFCIETGLPAYESLTLNQKIAYVHHELCHFGISELGNLTLLPHDIEEFNEVASVHGAYFERLQVFADAVEFGNSDTSARAELIKQILE